MSWIWSTDGTANDSVNLAPATGSVAVWDWILCLKQAGWTQQDSSDGTTHATNQVTGGGSGTNGLANTKAWVRIQDPAAVREYVIQRGTTDLVWRVKQSHSAKFTGGSPSATQVPSATDEQIVNSVGGGTDASPTFTTIFSTNNTYKFHVGADNASPYDWWWFACDSGGTTNPRRGWQLTMTSGSYPSEDVAPYICDFGGTSNPFGSSNIQGSGYYKKGLSGEAWVAFYLVIYYSQRAAAQYAPAGSSAPVNPYNGNQDLLPVPIGRDGGLSTPGWKGFLSLDTGGYALQLRAMPDYIDNVGATKRWFSPVSSLVLRWPTGVTPVT